MTTIYLDHNATTPVHPDALSAMLPLLKEDFGNPSSIHSQGRSARVHLDQARDKVAALIGAHPAEIIFTSGGTEADNLAVLGVARSLKDRGQHLVTTAIEHPAVLNPMAQLEAEGFQVTRLPVDREGRVSSESLRQALCDQTILVSIQHANSEFGTVQDIETLGALAQERGVLFHTDAVQTVGKIPFDVNLLPVDLVSMSSHKMYGPKGAGALYVKRGTPALNAHVLGGGQEKKRRGGTENVPAIAGFGKAAEIAQNQIQSDCARMKELQQSMKSQLENSIAGVTFHGHLDHSLPNTLSVSFDGVDGQSLLIRLDLEGISVSTGTACSSGATTPSLALIALGVPEDRIHSTLRLSLGRGTTQADVNRSVEVIGQSVQAIRDRTAVG